MNLIALSAVHLNNDLDLKHFHQMLDSWKHQVFPIKLYISISCDTQFSLNECFKGDPSLFIKQRHHKLTQFEHYRILVKDLLLDGISTSTYVIFSDHDDLWHTHRSFHFNNLINLTDRKVVYYKIPGVLDDDKDSDPMKSTMNYIEDSVNLDLLNNFFEMTDQLILNKKFCDIYFVRYLRSLVGEVGSFKSHYPLYNYRNVNPNSVTNLTKKSNIDLNQKIKNHIELQWTSCGSNYTMKKFIEDRRKDNFSDDMIKNSCKIFLKMLKDPIYNILL